MALTNAEHQAATRQRRKAYIERLETENVEMKKRLSTGHAACDARIAELEHTISVLREMAARRRVEIEDLKGYNDLNVSRETSGGLT